MCLRLNDNNDNSSNHNTYIYIYIYIIAHVSSNLQNGAECRSGAGAGSLLRLLCAAIELPDAGSTLDIHLRKLLGYGTDCRV